jgi:hypothetical protein
VRGRHGARGIGGAWRAEPSAACAQAGERPAILGAGLGLSSCAQDCPLPFLQCPASEASTGAEGQFETCSGHGRCLSAVGECDCYEASRSFRVPLLLAAPLHVPAHRRWLIDLKQQQHSCGASLCPAWRVAGNPCQATLPSAQGHAGSGCERCEYGWVRSGDLCVRDVRVALPDKPLVPPPGLAPPAAPGNDTNPADPEADSLLYQIFVGKVWLTGGGRARAGGGYVRHETVA